VFHRELQKILLPCYFTTPDPKTGKTPAEVMFGRSIKAQLDLIVTSKGNSKEKLWDGPKHEN